DKEGRGEILDIHTRSTNLGEDVNLTELAEITEGYVGSDLETIAREAALIALREDEDADQVDMRHFREALEKVRPTITEDIMDYYEEMKEEFEGGNAQIKSGRRESYIGFQ
ncbi:MAG: ATPase, partial [Halobacteria archaeon]|nr:ATPase [Halobacteria archaeon]